MRPSSTFKKCGTLYKPGCYLTLGGDQYNLNFGKVLHIVVERGHDSKELHYFLSIYLMEQRLMKRLSAAWLNPLRLALIRSLCAMDFRLRGVRMDGRLSNIPRDVVLVLTSFLHSNTGNDAVLEWSLKITQAETSLGDKDAASVGLIPLVVSYFKDDLSQLVQVHEISQAGRGGTSRILSSLSSVAGMTDALRRMRPLHFTVLSVYGSAASPGARQLNPVHLVSVAAYIRPASPVLPCSQRQNRPVSLRRYFVSWQATHASGSSRQWVPRLGPSLSTSSSSYASCVPCQLSS
ncbi:uncharacterized protein [Dermacentor albipictus]|uniref:uncharacterized protein isoform X3 n=1 Tax=Dermacentor albipictus TaxID=60249 RepID=UPI0038FC8946